MMRWDTVVKAVAIIVATVFVVASWLTSGTPDVSFLRYFSIAVLIASIALTVWDEWLWKTKAAQSLPMVPRDISGTWESTLESFWIDPATKKRIDPKTVYLVIRQTSSRASVTLISNESKSKSSMARIVEENGSWVLHYIYTNEPNMSVIHRSPIHHGSGVLEIVGKPVKRLRGSYWTDRETKGKLSLDKRSRKLAEDFDEGVELFSSVK